nr:hypothetical protein [Tanacetum cinerariifolium]
VLLILWGVINQAHIDYAERIWEEFTQSIHTFIKDNKNLTQHTQGKKKATLIMIPSVRFTKLIIYYLQSKHQFHPRLDSPLHLPNEELDISSLVLKEPNKNEEGSDLDSPAPKLAKATKKSKPSAPKADLRPPVIKPASSQQPKPKPTHANSLRSIDESVDEGIPEKEPRFNDEEADIQRVVEESLKSVYDAPRGPLPPVVIREPDSGKFQPLPETLKKVIPAKQYIFQRCTPTSTEPSVEAQDEGHAGPNPGVPTEGQGGSDPGNDAEPQPQSSPVVHAGPNLEHIDLESMDVSTQSHPEQMNEGFTTTAYLNVHENLKLTVEEQVILEEFASSTGTLSSLQHLAKDFSFGDLFFNDQSSEADNEKTTAETEAEEMMSVTIQQDTSAIPPMRTPVIDLTSKPYSPNVHRPLQATTTETTTTTTHLSPPQPQQSTTDSMLISASPPPPPPPAGPSRTLRYPRDSGSSQVPPLPPPLPSTNQEGQSHGSTAPSSSKTAASAEHTAWTTTNTRLRPFVSSIVEDLHIDDDMAPDVQAHSSDDEDIRNAHIPKVNLQQDW